MISIHRRKIKGYQDFRWTYQLYFLGRPSSYAGSHAQCSSIPDLAIDRLFVRCDIWRRDGKKRIQDTINEPDSATIVKKNDIALTYPWMLGLSGCSAITDARDPP